MSFVIEKKSDFVPPPEGTYGAAICDYEDSGMKDTPWGRKHKCRIYFQLDEKTDKGDRFIVAASYTVSLFPSSALCALVSTILGPDFDGKRVDLEGLIGRPCLVAIEHNEGKDGTIFGNVSTVTQLPRSMSPIKVEQYVRRKDRDIRTNGSGTPPPIVSRPKTAPSAATTAKQQADGISEDDVPAIGKGVSKNDDPTSVETVAEDVTDDDVPF